MKKIQNNMGAVDKLLRTVTSGLLLLVIIFANFATWIMVILALIILFFVITNSFSYDPIYSMFGLKTEESEKNKTS